MFAVIRTPSGLFAAAYASQLTQNAEVAYESDSQPECLREASWLNEMERLHDLDGGTFASPWTGLLFEIAPSRHADAG